MHFLAKERRRKNKKLKSRRERNKQKAIHQKAILKLTHHSKPVSTTSNHPSFIPPVSHAPVVSRDQAARKAVVVEGSCSATDAAKNNGIPIFVQERLEERNRKRGEGGSEERLLAEEVSRARGGQDRQE